MECSVSKNSNMLHVQIKDAVNLRYVELTFENGGSDLKRVEETSNQFTIDIEKLRGDITIVIHHDDEDEEETNTNYHIHADDLIEGESVMAQEEDNGPRTDFGLLR